jgi:predicted RecA/RadA family phage recombinase
MSQTQTPTRFRNGECEMIDYTPDSAVYAGDVIIINGGVYIAKLDIAADDLGALVSRGGRFVGPKTSSHGFAVNDDVYWDADGSPVGGTESTGAWSRVASGNTLGGKVTKAADAEDATVEFAFLSPGAANS